MLQADNPIKNILLFMVSIEIVLTMDVLYVHIGYSEDLYYLAQIYRIGLVVILFFYFALHNRYILKIRQMMAIMGVFILYIYCAIDCYEKTMASVTTFANMTLIAFVFLFDKAELKGILGISKRILVFVMFCSIIIYLLHIMNYGLSYSYITPSSNRDIYRNYYNYYGFLIMEEEKYKLRLCGIFNEPGVVGTFNALFLCIDNFNLKKVSNIILLVGGLLSLSLAFYILMALGIMIKLYHSRHNIVGILLIIFGGIFAYSINKQFEKNKAYYKMIIVKLHRLVYLGQSNRVSAKLNSYILSMKSSISKALYGYGYGFVEKKLGIATLKRVLCNLGVIGFALYGLQYWLTYLAAKEKTGKSFNEYSISFFIVFVISLYQRPYLLTFAATFILFAGIVTIDEEVSTQKISVDGDDLMANDKVAQI